MKHKKSRRFRGFDPDQFQKDVNDPKLINECQYLTDRIALRIQLVDLLTKVMRLVPPNFIERLNLARRSDTRSSTIPTVLRWTLHMINFHSSK